ncbi:MAG: hypothetical protein COB12_03285 [Flavobacterium sp.]|nr:MAG: hypothetical protein COB12_03285 [Flavobacterium sp.]
MKKLLLVSFLLFSIFSFAQEADTTTVKEGWSRSGKITLLINQSAFSNWQAGGDNNFAGNVNLNYDINYIKGDWTLDNKILASYGLTSTKDDGVRKTDDRLELNSILGKKIKEHWSASFFMNFKTQFTDGFVYEDDYLNQAPSGVVRDNEDFPTSGFFKPAYWSFGPGLLWKKNDNLYVNTSPLTAKFTFITSEIFTYNDEDYFDANGDQLYVYESSNDVETFGVDPGDSYLFEFGLNVRAYYKVEIMKNISVENILNLFSNYIDKPQNVDIDYTMNLVMKINDVFSTNLTFQTIYDDNAFQGFQVREIFGLGVNVNL